MATTVQAIRKLLGDSPDETTLTAAISSTSATTVTVTDINKFAVGQTWEFDDGATGAEAVLITAVTPSTSTITMKRGHKNTTAATHANGAVILNEPRFLYDTVAQAVNYVLDTDLYAEGLFELQEHQVTSSSTTDFYNSPAAGCLRFLDVYQKTASMDEPKRAKLRYSEYPTNVDTSLFANGKYFIIEHNYGVAGTDIYYVTCAHAMTISTLTTAAQRIVELLATAYVLEWSEPRRLAGPNNQGDTTVRPGASVGTAAYYRQLAEEMMSKERRRNEELFPAKSRFVRS
jgi:hypothetical protein